MGVSSMSKAYILVVTAGCSHYLVELCDEEGEAVYGCW